ncbi:ion transporter [Dyella jiangningensis]|uniref:Ion transporter n=1 Tax=Dyella jiangningensis TaxID=1379159 RepID=A0A328P412_9GAMM|nr:ion transporter [Dyella jiangningensis]RAO76759.1 ion transporter [Dyella jiangningensis]
MNVQPRFPFDSAIAAAAQHGWRARWFRIIFGHDDTASRLFDLVLMVAILASILVAVLDTVDDLHARLGRAFTLLEWLFTLAFTAEYLARLLVVSQPRRYAFSFFGIVDLVAVLPTYLTLLAAGGQHLMVVRALRILRIFRVLKMTRYVSEADMLWSTFLRARPKILVFFSTILTLVLIFGALMYLIEGPENGYTSIPRAMYWAVVTMTTVGFGDITPHTTLGQLVTSLIMLLGYCIIAVPTGIFAAELASGMRQARQQRRACVGCGLEGHPPDARYCRGCGMPLREGGSDT